MTRGRILHVCSDFTRQQLYPNLVAHLAEAGIEQEVYVPVRTAADASWRPSRATNVPHHLRHVLRPVHRALFRSKIRTVYNDVRSRVPLSEIGVTHAHFLYSDGAVALRLKQQHGIPFVVAVRNTDLNVFARRRPDLRWLRNEILRQASRVVFITPAYRSALLRRLHGKLRAQVETIASVVPNGIGSEWLTLASPPQAAQAGTLRLLYVGDFSKNKNLEGVLRSAAIVAQSRAVRVTLVGGGGDGEAEVRSMLASGSFDFAEHVGRIDDADALRAVYRQHDIFLMPSFTETFGIGYVEAMSQGLPIIHSAGQGVDGYFQPGTVSESVDPTAPADIAAKVHLLAERLPSVRLQCIDQAKRFEWSRVAATYRDLYLSIMSPRSAPAA